MISASVTTIAALVFGASVGRLDFVKKEEVCCWDAQRPRLSGCDLQAIAGQRGIIAFDSVKDQEPIEGPFHVSVEAL